MKKELFVEVEIPEGVEVKVDESLISVKGAEGENKKKVDIGKLKIEVKEGKVVIGNEKSTKREKKMMNTIESHVKNMIKGVQEKFVYNLKAVFAHFPFNVEVNGQDIVIKNFLGEKVDRTTTLPSGAEIEVNGQDIVIKSADKEIAGQAAANLEKVTRIRNKDRRIFQDGIFITNKAGKEI